MCTWFIVVAGISALLGGVAAFEVWITGLLQTMDRAYKLKDDAFGNNSNIRNSKLTDIPGIGPTMDRAYKLKDDAFVNNSNIRNSKLTDIPGIGPVAARRLMESTNITTTRQLVVSTVPCVVVITPHA
jgi:predicted flap endonuclease-1-like 5' DNA nuclease